MREDENDNEDEDDLFIRVSRRGFFFGDGDNGDFDGAIFFEVVMAGELVEGFATQAQRDGGGKFHVAQGFIDTANVLDLHVGQFGEGLAEERVAEVAFGIIGRIFDLAPGFDVTDEAGIA